MFVFFNVCVKCQPSHNRENSVTFSHYVSLLSQFRVVMSVSISAEKRCSVRLYLQLFLGGFVSCLRQLYLVVYSNVHHILYCAVILFVFVLCTLCCQFLSIVHFRLSLRYFLTCIFINWIGHYYLYSLKQIILTLVCKQWCPTYCCFSSSCVPYVASFSGLSMFDCSIGII